MSEMQVGVNAAPMHPWCRSSSIPVFDGVTPDVKSVGRPYDSFEEWKQANADKKIEAVAEEAAQPWVRIV
jgi:NAD+--asparagine ADP-ribosyltransferase